MYLPPPLHSGVFLFFFFLILTQEWVPSLSSKLHQEDCPYPLPVLLNIHNMKNRREKKNSTASINCHKSSPSSKSHIYWHNIHAPFLKRKLCVHTSVRSHHITYGEEILLFVCGLFLCFSSPGLSSGVLSLTLT